jgi:hypothetical protein
MKKLTRAIIMMSEAGAALLASVGTNDFTPYSREMIGYPPVQADQIIGDGDEATLGGVTLTCHDLRSVTLVPTHR